MNDKDKKLMETIWDENYTPSSWDNEGDNMNEDTFYFAINEFLNRRDK